MTLQGKVQLFPGCTKPPSPKRWHSQVLGKWPRLQFLSFVAIRKIGWESACITWTPPCVNSPHKQRARQQPFTPPGTVHWNRLARSAERKTSAGPVPMAAITPARQPGHHCSAALPLPSRAAQPDKSVRGAGLCLSWGFQTHYSKGGRGLALGRVNSGLKE